MLKSFWVLHLAWACGKLGNQKTKEIYQMNNEYRNRKEERHIRAELAKLRKLAIAANPEAMKEKKERREALRTSAINWSLLAGMTGMICGTYCYSQNKLAANTTATEQPCVERTVDEVMGHCPESGAELTADHTIADRTK